MTEGILELTKNVGIGVAICGMMGWMMSASSRYRQKPARGLGIGLLFGLSMLLPFMALIPLLLAGETPYWMAELWLASTVAYQLCLGVLFVKHRGPSVSVASVKAPVKESLNYASLGLNDISPAA